MLPSPLASTKNKLVFTGCWLTWGVVHFVMLYGWGFNWKLVLADTVFTNGLLALKCVLVINNLRFYRPKKNRYIYLLVLCVALAGLWSAVVKVAIYFIRDLDPVYTTFAENSMPVRFDIAILILGCMAMMSIIWYTSEDQKEIDQRKADTEVLAKDAELYSLRAQLQPHFLFNSLNSISALVGSKPEQARKMIQQLSEFLRGTLKKEEQVMVSLSEEVQQLELYLEIEKVRFGHRLNTTVDITEETRSMKIPPLLLQPLVENAIKFGLYDTVEPVTIEISSRKDNHDLVLVIQNPFDPETSSPKKGTGFGLSSAQRRLYLLFSRTDLLSTSYRNNLFTTTVKIPQYDQGNTDR